MKLIWKCMKRNWVMFVTFAILFLMIAFWIANYYKCSTMILAMIGSYKLGNWIGRFSVWTNDKVLGSEEDSNGD